MYVGRQEGNSSTSRRAGERSCAKSKGQQHVRRFPSARRLQQQHHHHQHEWTCCLNRDFVWRVGVTSTLLWMCGVNPYRFTPIFEIIEKLRNFEHHSSTPLQGPPKFLFLQITSLPQIIFFYKFLIYYIIYYISYY